MNYNIKQKFTAKDLAVGDLMYDVKDDVMVRIVFITNTATLSVEKTNKVEVRQFVLENTESKIIFLITSVGEKGAMPLLGNGNYRFRHLIKNNQVADGTITWVPSCPCYPHDQWWYYNQPYCGDLTGIGIDWGEQDWTTSTIINFSGEAGGACDDTSDSVTDETVTTFTINGVNFDLSGLK